MTNKEKNLKDKKIGVFCAKGMKETMDFTPVSFFKKNCDTKICTSDDEKEIEEVILFSNVIWIEGQDVNLHTLSKILNIQGRFFQKQVVLRLHDISSDFLMLLDNVALESLTDIVFRSEEMKKSFFCRYPKVKTSIIRLYQDKQHIQDILNVKSLPEIYVDNPKKEITLSACLMVRDEEKYIENCLKSLKGVVDEINIVDTGSKDSTMDICKRYGANIIESPWQDNFSLHRNESIKMNKSDWILIIDADETFKGNSKKLRKMLASLSPEYNGVALSVKDTDKESAIQFNSTRIFRKGCIQYKRRIHNVPVCKGIERYGAILFNDAQLNHYGSHYGITEQEKEKKTIRTKSLLLKSLQEDPTDYELHFYLMQLYGSTSEYAKAVSHGMEYLNNKNKIFLFNNSVYYSIIKILLELQDLPSALQWLEKAQIVLPLDMDIAFLTLEIGILLKKKEFVLEGARKYLKLFDLYNRAPELKGSRFVFTFKPDCLYFSLFHLTNCLFQEAIPTLENLKKSISILEKPEQGKAITEIETMLSSLNVGVN